MDIATYLSTKKISQASFALLIGVSPGLVYQWMTGRRPVSVEKCVLIERVTNGAVSRRDLRPHDWRDLWPELDSPEGEEAASSIDDVH